LNELDELRTFCLAHALPWSDRAEERFATYLSLLEQFNAKMNLVGALDRVQIVRSLFIDSVAPAAVAPPRGSILDVGSGAGLPGIPLEILYPNRPITLVEPRRKRAWFLEMVTNRLELNDVDVRVARIEDVDLPPHDWVVSKAFRAPTAWLDIARGLTADGGQIICLHASEATLELRNHARTLGLSEVSHVADVAGDLGASVPEKRAITVFAIL